ncbi:MAG: WecB/TagA/CpsF family glycosyltransferase [Planctomycetota bacterium]
MQNLSPPTLPLSTVAATHACVVDSIPVSRLSFGATSALLRRWLGQAQPRRVATANLDFLRLAHSDGRLRRCLQTADLVTADGWPVVALSKLTPFPVRGRVAGSDLVPALLRICAADRRRVFFLGSDPDTAATAIGRIRTEHPNLIVAGQASPFIDWDCPLAVGELLDGVREAQPDLLLVALGCPRQDLFLEQHLAATGARVGIGIGGTLDFFAGKRVRAPWILRRLGLEWSVRLLQEPTRLTGRYLRDLEHLVQLVRRMRSRRGSRWA